MDRLTFVIHWLKALWHGDQQAHHAFDMWMNGLGKLRWKKQKIDPFWQEIPHQTYTFNGKTFHSDEWLEPFLQSRLQKCREWREAREYSEVSGTPMTREEAREFAQTVYNNFWRTRD